jgi:hypothetical protein
MLCTILAFLNRIIAKLIHIISNRNFKFLLFKLFNEIIFIFQLFIALFKSNVCLIIILICSKIIKIVFTIFEKTRLNAFLKV